MLMLELDWAGETPPDLGRSTDDERVLVERGSQIGPSGWPTIKVFVEHEEGAPKYMASMSLVGWLKDVYLAGLGEDELELQADELAGLAREV
jgi:hypothetical protein